MKKTLMTTTVAAPAAPRTMQDVEALLPSLGYSSSSEANVRAAIRKCRTAYDEKDLARIPADLAAFERKWGVGRVSHLAAGFKSRDQFIRWRKDMRAVLRRTTAAPTPKTILLAPWREIVRLVRENQGKGKLFGANSDITLGLFVREASADGRLPADVDLAWIDRASRRLKDEARKSFRRGMRRMNRVIEHAAVLPEIAHHLPAAALPEPTLLRDPPSAWLRSARHPGMAALWAEFDAIMDRKRFGESGPQIDGEPADFEDSSADAYGRAVEWLLKPLAKADMLDAEDAPGLSDVVTHANLVFASNAWIEARETRGLPTDKGTFHAHVTKLVHLATGYLGVSDKERRRLLELRRNKRIRTKSVGRMSADREKWIRDFDANPVLQRAAHRLPETLRRRSQAILNRLKTNRRPTPKEIMAALRMGVAAMMAAVLFRASPVRAANLRRLRFRGENPDFRIDWRAGTVRVVIPGEQVKNGEDIDDPDDGDLAPILEWYLGEIRSRLIADHPYNRAFCDSDHLFPSTTSAPMEESMAASWYGFGCTEGGVPMTLHQARHVSVYWILSVDPNAWAEAAAVLHVDEMTVRKHYAWMNAKRANDAGRAKLREARKTARKHRKGGVRRCRVSRFPLLAGPHWPGPAAAAAETSLAAGALDAASVRLADRWYRHLAMRRVAVPREHDFTAFGSLGQLERLRNALRLIAPRDLAPILPALTAKRAEAWRKAKAMSEGPAAPRQGRAPELSIPFANLPKAWQRALREMRSLRRTLDAGRLSLDDRTPPSGKVIRNLESTLRIFGGVCTAKNLPMELTIETFTAWRATRRAAGNRDVTIASRCKELALFAPGARWMRI
jgi:hypothetical protein